LQPPDSDQYQSQLSWNFIHLVYSNAIYLTICDQFGCKSSHQKRSGCTYERFGAGTSCYWKLLFLNPITGLDRPWGFQEDEAPRFQDNLHMKVVRLSALCTGCLYPQETFLVLISFKGWVDPKAIAGPKGLC